jgi:hypothetical protein
LKTLLSSFAKLQHDLGLEHKCNFAGWPNTFCRKNYCESVGRILVKTLDVRGFTKIHKIAISAKMDSNLFFNLWRLIAPSSIADLIFLTNGSIRQ